MSFVWSVFSQKKVFTRWKRLRQNRNFDLLSLLDFSPYFAFFFFYKAFKYKTFYCVENHATVRQALMVRHWKGNNRIWSIGHCCGTIQNSTECKRNHEKSKQKQITRPVYRNFYYKSASKDIFIISLNSRKFIRYEPLLELRCTPHDS